MINKVGKLPDDICLVNIKASLLSDSDNWKKGAEGTTVLDEKDATIE